jgi:hypothetical protein
MIDENPTEFVRTGEISAIYLREENFFRSMNDIIRYNGSTTRDEPLYQLYQF